MARPVSGTYGAFYQGYVDAATGNDLAALIQLHSATIRDVVLALPDEKADFSYAEGKWTIKQLLQHLIDSERVFSYRAMRISRNDQTPLAGFDENIYAANAPVQHRSLDSLKQEFCSIRAASDLMLATFTESQLLLMGQVNGHPMNLNAICFILIGHNLHHIKILRERYL